MQPTEAGLALLGHARSMLRIVEHMHDDAQSFSGGGRGLVRLAVCTSAAIQFVPRDLQRHRHLYPQIDIEIMEATSRDVLKELMLGHTELAIAEAKALTRRTPAWSATPTAATGWPWSRRATTHWPRLRA